MKKYMHWGTPVKSVASFLAIGVFVWLMVATTYNPPVRTPLYGDRVMEVTSYKLGAVTYYEETNGHVNKHGNWDGEITIVSTETEEGETIVTERITGNYSDGNRNGPWIIEDRFGKKKTIYYENGTEVTGKKSGTSGNWTGSAFDTLQARHTLFLISLENFKFSDDKIRSYTDSLEAGLARKEFEQSGFESAYESVRSDLDEDPVYDSISGAVAYIAHYAGLYELKKNELRLAVIDRAWAGSGTTYAVVDSIYPGYRAHMNSQEVTDAEFELFCHKLDSTMDTYGPLDRNDALFVDTVDARLYRAIGEMGAASSSFRPLLAINAKAGGDGSKALRDEAMKTFRDLEGLKTGTAKAMNVFLTDMLNLYNEADAVRVSVRAACFATRQWARLPEVTTVYSEAHSLTSVAIRGNVIGSGGAAVTARGVAWADTYNPSVTDHVVEAGTGTGVFLADINGLEPGKVYYARAFATNGVGTAYGNVVWFTTERASSAEPAGKIPFSAALYPNPVIREATLTLNSGTPVNCRLTLLAVDGRAVYQQEIRHPGQGSMNVKLDLSALPPGIYCCRLTGGAGTTAIRLLKTE